MWVPLEQTNSYYPKSIKLLLKINEPKYNAVDATYNGKTQQNTETRYGNLLRKRVYNSGYMIAALAKTVNTW